MGIKAKQLNLAIKFSLANLESFSMTVMMKDKEEMRALSTENPLRKCF